MELIKLRLLKSWHQYNPGDIIAVDPSMSPKVVQSFIDDGIAERYLPNKTEHHDLG